jgi:ABC-type multidrug transport system ATPase subunit
MAAAATMAPALVAVASCGGAAHSQHRRRLGCLAFHPSNRHPEQALSTFALELADIEVRYGGSAVLRDIRLQVESSQWIALVGPNASGKSTLLRCAAGQLAPAKGQVRVQGTPLYPAPQGMALARLAVAPETLPAFLSVRLCLDIYAEAHGLDAVPPDCEQLALNLGLAKHLDLFIGACSLGTRQKLAIVLALMTRPPVLLLDEVFNGLDAGSALFLKNELRARVTQGMSILLATHALDLVARHCDGLALLEDGTIVQQWNAAALRALGTEGLEQALATASRGAKS